MSKAAKAIDVTEELSRAVESGDVEVVARLLPRVVDINARNRHGTTVLMRAARCGHAEIVRLLLEHGADPNVTRNDKFTALALAAFFGHTETVKTLMEFGARTEAVTRCGASAQTWATVRTFAEVARCLDVPTPKTTEPPVVIGVQPQRNSSRRGYFTLGVIATFIVMLCCGFGALVLRKSEAHDLPPVASQPHLPPPPPPAAPPPQVEAKIAEPAPPPPAPEPVASKTAALVRPTIQKIPARTREAKLVTVVTEKPVGEPAERVQTEEPPVVVKPKPKFDPPKPAAISPQIMAPTKKAKVIQWP